MMGVGLPISWTSRYCPCRRLLLSMTLAGLMGSLTACTTGPVARFAPSQTADGDRTDPYVQFTQAVTAVEPLVSPELEAIARSQTVSGGNPVSQNSVPLPTVVPLMVEGNVAIATSPQLLPLNELMYERFVQGGYQGLMNINAVPSSQAIRQFCQPGQQHTPGILTISRPMTEAEITACQAQSRSPVGIAIGKDALVLVVHAQNEFLEGITLGHLNAILTQNSWSSIRSNWPQQPIVRYLMGPDSDTVRVLATHLFDGTNAIATTENTKYFEHTEPMIQALGNTPDGVGIFSYATVRRSPSVFKTLPINGITASPDTITQGTYPLGQTLYLYVDQHQLQGQFFDRKTSPMLVVDWVNFYLTYINEVLPEVELLPLNPQQFKTSVQQWSTLIRE